MHGRVHDLSRIVLSQQRYVVIFLLVLAGGLLFSSLAAEAKSDYEIINTGIKGGGCWYDDNHFIVIKGQQPAPGQEFEVEGLYYLNPSRPTDLKRIDLSPLEPSQQKHIRDVTCQDQTILFHILATDKKRNTIYSLNIGQSLSKLVEMSGGFILPRAVNVRTQSVLSFFPALGGHEGQVLASAKQAMRDCHIAFVSDNYRVACLRHDRGTKQTWLANKTFLTKYQWDETIRVNKDGQYQWVPNPEPPLKLPDGTELKQGYLLRDLENRIVSQVNMDQPPYKIYRGTLKLNPQGDSLYAACSKAGDHGTRVLTVGGRICRFQLDRVNQQWIEVVAVQQSPQDPLSLQYLDINQRGDVVAWEPAYGGASIFWKYSAQTHRVEKVRQAPTIADLGGPQLSPTGRWISFLERQTLYLAQAKGVRP